ncbi:MAG: hypothetical protein HZB65_03380 [Candidatus Aenigmarchaeota archaeon]|nr:hypothetical protein [Candidatus Aenigmarchaeota archaeon]
MVDLYTDKHRHSLNPAAGGTKCSDPKAHTGKYDEEATYSLNQGRMTAQNAGANWFIGINYNTNTIHILPTKSLKPKDPEHDYGCQITEGWTYPAINRSNGEGLDKWMYYTKDGDKLGEVLKTLVGDARKGLVAVSTKTLDPSKLNFCKCCCNMYSDDAENLLENLYPDKPSGTLDRKIGEFNIVA